MKKISIWLIFFLIVFSLSGVIFAGDEDDIEDLEEKIEKYEKKLNELASQGQSLSREISYAETQISLTQTRIENSLRNIQRKEKQIVALADDITNLEVRIDRIAASIKFQKEILQERLRERYKSRPTSFVELVFGSESANKIVQKTKYLQIMEEQDHLLIEKMEKTKKSYDLQKSLFEQKKKEEEQLKAELEQEKRTLDSYKIQLENQKIEKERLLKVTQNDEAKYQKLLDEAKKELSQITGAVAVLKGTDGTKVKKGQQIGIQGNTGFSKGDHLHFGVYKYSSFDDIDGWDWYYSNYVDPAKKLKSKTVYWNDGCSNAGNRTVGSGDWSWPITSPTISQGYGTTCWSPIYYGGKVHPAYDMYGPYGAAVYAVEDGDAYFCKNCLGDGANGVFIFHEDGYMTLYWHLR